MEAYLPLAGFVACLIAVSGGFAAGFFPVRALWKARADAAEKRSDAAEKRAEAIKRRANERAKGDALDLERAVAAELAGATGDVDQLLQQFPSRDGASAGKPGGDPES